MDLTPKPFQRAAIDSALRAFAVHDGPRRFLVADEVGLGKTVVARGVVERLVAGRTSPLSVFYVCSNLALARQNLDRLAGFLPKSEWAAAISKVDRPSLMPADKLPDHPRLRLYSLSPETALATGGRRRSGGRVQERALAAALLDRILPQRPRGLHSMLRLNAGMDVFKGHYERYSERYSRGEIGVTGFAFAFRDALRRAMKLTTGQHLPPRIVEAMQDGSLPAKLRSALASAALASVKPDLVILDEFQRFRDLLDMEAEDGDDAAARVLEAIRGGGQGGPALLLLSATPYVPYRRKNDRDTTAPAADFYELVRFLAGSHGEDTCKAVGDAFASLGEELRKGICDPQRTHLLRRRLEQLLRPLMCRTERSRISVDVAGVESHSVQLVPDDVVAFKSFAQCLSPEHREWSVPLWTSVPLPVQTLGSRYQAWDGISWKAASPAIVLSEADRNAFRLPSPFPHPRLRALLDAMPLRQLAQPWVAPSDPWWTLRGAWANNKAKVDGKLLVFSRFRATPPAVAGLVSYAAEAARRRISGNAAWESVTERSRLSADPDRPALLALFHVSPLLVALDPLQARGRGDLAMRASLDRQLKAALAKYGVKVVPNGPRSRPLPVWHLLAALERHAGLWEASRVAWNQVIEEVRKERQDQDAGRRLSAMIERWEQAPDVDITVLDDEEARALAQWAMDSPGVVLARAISRHWPDATTSGRGQLASLSWRALRAYLDKPWLDASLGVGLAAHFSDRLRHAVVEGNLEAVLDEHFWFLSGSGGSWPEKLDEFSRALRLRTGTSTLHEGANGKFRLRCHVAMALTEARLGSTADDESDIHVRPDEVRHAFNSPFWPHVLVTTSVGQEGLDFHPWCRAIAHWDLPSGPVALEQREGRITRYAGLAVRRELARKIGNVDRAGDESPWQAIARKAEQTLADETGLQPWWITPGASVQRLLLTVPGAEISEQMVKLARERGLYRFALGMPDQADLVALLASRGAETTIDRDAVCVNLMAMTANDVEGPTVATVGNIDQ